MKSTINNLFFRKMKYSALIQFCILAIILLAMIYTYNEHHEKTAKENILLRDFILIDEIAKYHVLKNSQALDLLMLSIQSEHQLDSVRFIPGSRLSKLLLSGECAHVGYDGHYVCTNKENKFVGITPVKINNEPIGFIVISKQYYALFPFTISIGLLIILAIVGVVFCFNFLFVFWSAREVIDKATKNLLNFIKLDRENSSEDLSKIEIVEYANIAESFIEKRNEIIHLETEKSFHEARRNIAEKVAHDIRSPIATINMMMSMLTVPDDSKTIIRSACDRINAIANNLLSEYRNPKLAGEDTNQGGAHSINVCESILDIIAEKKCEYLNKGVSIKFSALNEVQDFKLKTDQTEFKRVISNLINNSMEAIKNVGSIEVSVYSSVNRVIIDIIDTGCGIPPDILPKLLINKFTYNKVNGTGFGLFSAKEYMDSVNGELHIKSSVGEGTVISWECHLKCVNSQDF